jgi:hypothetical protein
VEVAAEVVMARVLVDQVAVALVVLAFLRYPEQMELQIQVVAAVVLIAVVQAPEAVPVLVALELLFLGTLIQ